MTAVGGAREGAGRPVDEFRAYVRTLVEKHRLIEFLADVAGGSVKEIIGKGTKDEETIYISVGLKQRIYATIQLIEHGWGRAPMKMEFGLDEKTLGSIVRILTEAADKAIPDRCPNCNFNLHINNALADELVKISEKLISGANESQQASTKMIGNG